MSDKLSIKSFRYKKLALLGLGVENFALLRYLLAKKANCEITICDKRKKREVKNEIDNFKKFKNIKWQLGEKIGNRNLIGFDYLFRSPGGAIDLPDIGVALKSGTILTSPMKLFFNLCPTRNIIGVTGTKGKGTTATLIYEILKEAKKRAWLGGNIGIAPFAFLNKVKKNDWVVLELSSFQLEDMAESPSIAVITNFRQEHLAPADPQNPNYHKTLKKYLEAKLNIIKWQKKGDWAIINNNFQLKKIKSKIIYFTKSNLPSGLIGEHNKENIAAAVEVAKIIGIKNEIIKKAVKKFKGLEHRLEFVREIKGVKYYNDTFATTPESTITALESFQEPIILLAGGAEKNSNYNKLAQEIKKLVKFIVLLNGDATPRIKRELLKIKYPRQKIELAYNIKDAVYKTRKTALSGDIVLLSPACASFGMFKNYKERGRLFKQEVKKLK